MHRSSFRGNDDRLDVHGNYMPSDRPCVGMAVVGPTLPDAGGAIVDATGVQADSGALFVSCWGYCFEQNLLFSRALRAIGFSVTTLSARIAWNRPPDMLSPRSHMLLLADLAGVDHVVDVGFGGMTLTGALELVADRAQPTAHEDFHFRRVGSDWMIEARVKEAWAPIYRFNTEPQVAGDYEISNYFLSTNPASHFTTGLMLARAEPGRRWALSNRRLVEHRLNGESVRQNLPSAEAVIDVIKTVFGIVPPDREALRRRIEALPE